MKPRLVIFAQEVSKDSLEKVKLKKDDHVLALSLVSMKSLEELNIPFLSLKSFVDREVVTDIQQNFQRELICLLEELDSECQGFTGIAKSFSGSGFWILHRLSDLFFIDLIISKISQHYSDVLLVSGKDLHLSSSLEVGPRDLIFSTFGSGIEHLLSFLSRGLPNLEMVIDDNVTSLKNNRFNSTISSLVKRSPEILTRYIKKYAKLFFSLFKQSLSRKSFWIIQDNYDVGVLKEYYSLASFYKVDSADLFATCPDTVDKTLWSLSLFQRIETFSQKHFSFLVDEPTSFFRQYYQQIVSRIPSMLKEVHSLLDRDNPSALLYSQGASNIAEYIFALVANQKNTPVFYFKHGGVENLFLKDSNLDLFFEREQSIKRTQFVHTLDEVSKYDGTDVEVVPSGPLSRIHYSYRKKPSKKIKKVLYSMGAPESWSFKDLYKITLDMERFDFSQSLVAECIRNKLELSFKVHPAEWSLTTKYVKKLQFNTSASLKLIQGGSIERIIKNYDVLVLDMLSTRVLSGALYTQIPIILYVPKNTAVSTKDFNLLKQRVYVVAHQSEIKQAFKKILEGEKKDIKGFHQKYFSNQSFRDSLQKVVEKLPG